MQIDWRGMMRLLMALDALLQCRPQVAALVYSARRPSIADDTATSYGGAWRLTASALEDVHPCGRSVTCMNDDQLISPSTTFSCAFFFIFLISSHRHIRILLRWLRLSGKSCTLLTRQTVHCTEGQAILFF